MFKNHWSNDMDYNIDMSGLTPLEKWFLYLLLEIKTTEEMELLKSCLLPPDLQIVEKLQHLILIEYLDLELNKKNSFPYAKKLLEKYK